MGALSTIQIHLVNLARSMTASARSTVGILMAFIYLQLLDGLTTIAFIMYGVGEANPIVRWFMREASNPVGGLFLIKLLAVMLAICCVSFSRHGVVRKVNVFFAVVVAYNVVALIMAAPVLR